MKMIFEGIIAIVVSSILPAIYYLICISPCLFMLSLLEGSQGENDILLCITALIPGVIASRFLFIRLAPALGAVMEFCLAERPKRTQNGVSAYEQAKPKANAEWDNREKERLDWESKVPRASEVLRNFERYLAAPTSVPSCHPDEVRWAIIVRRQTSGLRSLHEQLKRLSASLAEVKDQMEFAYMKANPEYKPEPLTKAEHLLELQARIVDQIEKR